MTDAYATSRLLGWAWADGSIGQTGCVFPSRIWSARTRHARECVGVLGWVVDREGDRLRVTFAARRPPWTLACAEDPLAALASVIECEGSRDGLLYDGKTRETVDECEVLLERVLPHGGWRRTRWASGGGSLWVTSIGLSTVQALPFVTLRRVPTRGA